MRVLATHAGRHGDALWALPTVRAIAETVEEPVDFCVSVQYRNIVPLVGKQEYIGFAAVDDQWSIRETAPITPTESPGADSYGYHSPEGWKKYDKVIHLSMKGWPMSKTLADGYWLTAAEQVPGLRPLDLERPWIKADPEVTQDRVDVAVGFTDNWFELVYGLFNLVTDAFWEEEVHFAALAAPGSRWQNEAHWMARSWEEAATLIDRSKLFFGCCSALWVLANALGKRAVIAEPMEGRWDKVFWLEHPRNRMVMGGDGRPTWDARACVQQVRAALEEAEKEE